MVTESVVVDSSVAIKWVIPEERTDAALRARARFAIMLGHPAYDCVYIAAAAKLECGFLTADSSLIRKLRQFGFEKVKCMDLTQEI